jgi:hypothetical protein
MSKEELIQNLQLDLENINDMLESKLYQGDIYVGLLQAKRVTVKSLIELGAFDEH